MPEGFASPNQSHLLYEDVRYEDYWDGAARRRQDALEQRIVSEMLPARGRRIVDLGCGFGRLARCYVDRFDLVVLFDGSMSLLRQAKASVGERAVLVAGDMMRLPFRASSFDCVLSIRVLQHMSDLEGAIQGVGTILSSDGALLFSYHNKRNVRRILHHLASRRVANPFSPESTEVSPTLLSHHPARVAASLEAAGLSAPAYQGAFVVNPIARAAESLGSKSPSGLGWARFTGTHLLAPWLIGRAHATGGGALAEARTVDDLFECPVCRGELTRRDRSLACAACRREYPVTDGIIDLRP